MKISSSVLAKMICVLAVVLLGFSSLAVAQSSDLGPSKLDIFAGYSYMEPGGQIGGVNLKSMPMGWGVAPTWNFNRTFGLTFDAGGHYGDNADAATIMVGPKLTLHMDRVAPFAEFLVGLHRLSPSGLSDNNAFGLVAGGGFDVRVARHLSLRLLQADYVFGKHSDAYPLPNTGNLNGARVQGGLVFNLFTGPVGPGPSAACSAQPSEVMQGEPVHITANPSNFDPKHTLNYSWSATGGKAAGNGATANVDTAGVAPGNYTATANIADAKNAKKTASCSANFSVKELPKNAPQISCSANPATVTAGNPSTVSCTCSSPDNRQVSVANWVASAGKVSGTGNSATLDTAGMQAGPVSVSATCTDDRGLSATGNANVNVEVPAKAPEASKLNEIDFKKNSAHVDNKAKAALDDVALRLKSDPEAKAVIIGEYAKGEKAGQKLAAQRAVNAKSYLTQGEAGQGIDASRIDVRTGNGGEMKDENWIVPAGGTFDSTGTQAVDETKVKPNQSFGTSRSGAAPKKKAAKKAAAPKQ
ncbi:MAG: OmpA family protein [Terriglobales bacterium]|jgi:outer membrane protein OmpA-like peptidoglycan-associated protein